MTEPAVVPIKPLTRKDFVSDQEVRWCPGCGDYAILAQIQKVLPELKIPRENFVFVSGIGCSSRLPYYMNTYGFHTIHGRAPTIASGVKIANPNLSVWVITGDGDALSIGGNHLIHSLRRNMDIKILLVNNRIYGLTKGQYSPTSEIGKVTKSTPYGSIEQPLNALSVAIAAEATFVARAIDTDSKNLGEILTRAAHHKGSAFVEILQNCNVFNDGAFKELKDRTSRDETGIYLDQGKPLIFGKDMNKGIHLNGINPEVVTLGENGITEKDILIHDDSRKDPSYSHLIARLTPPQFPTPIGVFRHVSRPAYSQALREQVQQAQTKFGEGNLEKLIHSGDTWTVSVKDHIEGKGSTHYAGEDTVPVSFEEGDVGDVRAALMGKKVVDIEGKLPITVEADTTILQAVQVMRTKKVGCLLVADNNRLVGIITERDILMQVLAKKKDVKKTLVKSVMTRQPETLAEDTPVAAAFNKMSIGEFRHIPVIQSGKPVSVLSIRDLLRYVVKNFPESISKK
jgi:2-oxoglutarate/2-oxoacid ferredoxin oxidoreductase subunit beta